MLAYFIIGVSLLIALIIGGQSLVQADPKKILKAFRVAGVIIFAVLAGFFLLTGRFSFALPLAGIALLLLRNRPFFGGSRPSAGQSSGVETDWLSASLDHDSGEMDAFILKGRFEGKKLSQLTHRELLDLRTELVADEQSCAILDSFLDRHFSGEAEADEGARTSQNESAGRGNGRSRSSSGAMNRQEALEILGLDGNATVEDIKAAHRRLMKKFHPDHDGSDYMAAKLNAAKDFLLKT